MDLAFSVNRCDGFCTDGEMGRGTFQLGNLIFRQAFVAYILRIRDSKGHWQ